MQDRLTLIKLIKNSCAHSRKSHSLLLRYACVSVCVPLRARARACLRVVALLVHSLFHFMSLRRDFGGGWEGGEVRRNIFNSSNLKRRTILLTHFSDPHPPLLPHTNTYNLDSCLFIPSFFLLFSFLTLLKTVFEMRRRKKEGGSSGSGSREERRGGGGGVMSQYN